IGRLELMAEGREGLAEAQATGVGGGVGPEEIDEEVAGMGAEAVEGKVGEEGSGLVGAEAGELDGSGAGHGTAQGLKAPVGMGRRHRGAPRASRDRRLPQVLAASRWLCREAPASTL